jgi:hypothetical protein
MARHLLALVAVVGLALAGAPRAGGVGLCGMK